MKLVITSTDKFGSEDIEINLPKKPSERIIYRTVQFAEELSEQLDFCIDRHELIREMTIGREYAEDIKNDIGPNKFEMTLTV